MSIDIYKNKYIKYKKKYNQLKKLNQNVTEILNKIIIIPKEYNILDNEQKKIFKIYEIDKNNFAISYINIDYLKKISVENEQLNISSSVEQDNILNKNIISPDEYFLLSELDKAKYQINECDFNKIPNRVVPKNYSKIIMVNKS